MFISTNLVSIVVRGLVEIPFIKNFEAEAEILPVLRKEVKVYKRFNFWFTLFCIVGGVVFIYVLFRIWNIGVAMTAVLLMVARVPDLLFEIRTGRKVSRWHMPRGLVSTLLALLIWATLPLLWFSLR